MSSDEVLDIFREEARDHLGALEKAFLDLDASDVLEVRRGLIDNAFRHAHSLKSDAKVVGLPQMKLAAQELEDLLDELRDHPEAINHASIDRSLARFDQVRSAFDQWQSGTDSSPTATAPQQHRSPTPRREAVAAPSPTEPPAAADSKSSAEESFTVRVPSERLNRLLSLAGELRITQRSGHLIVDRLAELRRHLEAFKREPPSQPAGHGAKIENLLDQLRRIDGDFRRWRGHGELLVESLEDNIRQARLLPLSMLTDTLRRTVRDLSQSLAKPIAYQSQVGSIMLDKAVIEALKDPLMHLVRNAADHGIEPAAARSAAGKPDEGSIRIAASRRGQLVRIEISDDGRGVDFSRVREQLAERGGCDAAEIAQLSERELACHLFKAGFTTAAAGEVSGRGVGLDVVLDTVRRLQGTVELESSSPAGTTFSITVPVTVSTVRILTVLEGSQYYGIPSSVVVRTGRARRSELHELEGSLVLSVEGEPVRWVHLAELLGSQRSQRAELNGESMSYLLISAGGRQMAVAVDDLEDEAEVLLKPLGFPLTGMAGLVGATVRADGAMQLVLDLADRSFTKAGGAHARPALVQKPAGRILIVDDSPTTRAVLRKVFTAAGYVVTTATDGIDALERLATQTVDLVISDVEMPRLGGIDLTRNIKARHGLPVILVSGREKEQHRRDGFEAGADAYVVKSTFEDRGLLEIVAQFL